MLRDTETIVAELNGYCGNNTDWRGLDRLVEELFLRPITAAGIDAMLGVFERHPTHDGFGVFWTLLHGIESAAGYEPHLLRSVRRRPSLFGVYMINRILNVGEKDIGDVSWISVLKEVSSCPGIAPEVQETAGRYLGKHAN